MFTIESVVWTILYLIGMAAIFGLLYYAISYAEANFPNAGPIWRFARIFLVIAACFILIFLILGMMGHPIIRFAEREPRPVFAQHPHPTPVMDDFTYDLLLKTAAN